MNIFESYGEDIWDVLSRRRVEEVIDLAEYGGDSIYSVKYLVERRHCLRMPGTSSEALRSPFLRVLQYWSMYRRNRYAIRSGAHCLIPCEVTCDCN